MKPIYEALYFQIFTLIYFMLAIITSFVCNKISKRKGLNILFWTIIGWFFPIIPYVYLKFRYKG
jgi:hypothetical protein